VITVAAIFVGPIAALGTQRFLDRIHETKDRRVKLSHTVMAFRATCKAVSYEHTVEYKTQFYYPQYHADAEAEQLHIRKQFAKAITNKGLKVVVDGAH